METTNNIDIKIMPANDIKALIYDCMVLIEQSQNNIKLLNEELKSRSIKTPEVVTPERTEQGS